MVQLRHVAADQQRRSQQAPEADVRVLLVGLQSASGADVPQPTLPTTSMSGSFQWPGPAYARGRPARSRCRTCSPQVSVMSPVVRQQLPPTSAAPLPDVAHAILAEAEDDVAVDLVQRCPHHVDTASSAGGSVSLLGDSCRTNTSRTSDSQSPIGHSAGHPESRAGNLPQSRHRYSGRVRSKCRASVPCSGCNRRGLSCRGTSCCVDQAFASPLPFGHGLSLPG